MLTAPAFVDGGFVDGGLTTSVAAVVWTNDPAVPAIVSVALPAGVLAAVVTFSVAVPEPVIDEGVNEADALAGRPVAVRFTVPANPLSGATVIA
jgi:hypothetical protein